MQPTATRILDLKDDPVALEALYRQDPGAFRDALSEAANAAPDATSLRVWRARLDYKEPADDTRSGKIWRALGIGAAVGVLIRVPAIWLGEEWYYPRLGPSLVVLSVAAYFWFEHRERTRLIAGSALAAIAVIYTSLLPSPPGETGLVFSDSIVMALIHLPILFWIFVGFVFTADAWRESAARIRFVRYNGELLILATLVGLGLFVFSALTVGLFQLVLDDIEELYFANIGLIGAAAVPVAATYLYDVVFKRHTGIASVLARVFAPLFLVMTSLYLIVAFGGGQSPFVDRDFLILFNGLLIVVLGMTVFSIAERGHDARVGWFDYVNAALLVVTLIIDLIALSAILFRLTSYGLTPNRVIVLGANLVIMAHLAWIGRAYLGFVMTKQGAEAIPRAVARYLPVYGAWAALVVFAMPLVFGFA
ncbi:MAG: hypothetical protein R3305_01815 [Gammaproteobacteria bacterium]|nr:hypothetical protein [Gammaproteobacteria bacterium]